MKSTYRPPLHRTVTVTESVDSHRKKEDKINQYKVLNKIGDGAFGDIYKVIEPISSSPEAKDKVFAMKVIQR